MGGHTSKNIGEKKSLFNVGSYVQLCSIKENHQRVASPHAACRDSIQLAQALSSCRILGEQRRVVLVSPKHFVVVAVGFAARGAARRYAFVIHKSTVPANNKANNQGK